VKSPFKARLESDFGRVLADVRRAGERDEERDARLANPAASAAFPLGDSDTRGVETLQDAFDWFVDQDLAQPDERESLLSEDPETIARELGLEHAKTEDDLNRARRRFMWRNHPDRRDEAQRGLADRRVAIANMLIDRAREKLARSPQP
jgi:hypothetical protein